MLHLLVVVLLLLLGLLLGLLLLLLGLLLGLLLLLLRVLLGLLLGLLLLLLVRVPSTWARLAWFPLVVGCCTPVGILLRFCYPRCTRRGFFHPWQTTGPGSRSSISLRR